MNKQERLLLVMLLLTTITLASFNLLSISREAAVAKAMKHTIESYNADNLLIDHIELSRSTLEVDWGKPSLVWRIDFQGFLVKKAGDHVGFALGKVIMIDVFTGEIIEEVTLD
jgi:hypothetical protein